MGKPLRSSSGSTPKSLRRKKAQLSRRGRGFTGFPKRTNTPAQARYLEAGASKPK
jgi:hypothetical protein